MTVLLTVGMVAVLWTLLYLLLSLLDRRDTRREQNALQD